MNEEKEFLLGLAVLLGTLIIPSIDETYITSRMKESGLRMEVQCHDEPNKCWIQKRVHK
jgi:hypothetical protein